MDISIVKSKILARSLSIGLTEIDAVFGDSGVDYSEDLVQLLEEALLEKNGVAVDLAIHSIYQNGPKSIYLDVLCRLLADKGNWNYSHERIAVLLGAIRDPEAIEHLYHAVLNFPLSDLHSIQLKAMWALRDIGTESAREKLELLSRNENARIAEIAKLQFDYLNKLKAGL